MADEAFALSPISARAAQPSEEDYDAIRDAFMETSRGRWFLGEYAKRNRNADTSMVLDAVARIEENLAAQRHQASHGELAEALAAIRKAVDEARAAASIAIDGLALEQTLAPIRKGARVVREIAWRWREIGTDGRICDLLDSQVSSIEAGCGRIASIDPRGELGAAFDLIAGRIAEFDDSEASPPQTAEKAPASPAPASSAPPPDQVPAATVDTAPAAASPETATAAPATTAETLPATEEPAELTAEDAAAHDDAVLDMVAMEMAAPDPLDADPAEIHVPEPPPVRSEVIARQPEPAAAPAIQPAPWPLAQPSPRPSLQPALALQPSLEPPPAPSLEASREPSREPSLGSSLIASGILSKPKASGPDPLAPIRRMSQAEKLAFFS